VFKDNSGALEMANVHKWRPRTKHLNVKLHHFRDYVTKKEISINPIDTSMQLADYLTSPFGYSDETSSVSNGMVITGINPQEGVLLYLNQRWSSHEMRITDSGLNNTAVSGG
jgi:hypothetical protein